MNDKTKPETGAATTAAAPATTENPTPSANPEQGQDNEPSGAPAAASPGDVNTSPKAKAKGGKTAKIKLLRGSLQDEKDGQAKGPGATVTVDSELAERLVGEHAAEYV